MQGAAFYDVDGTLTRTSALLPLVWYQRAHLSGPAFALWCCKLATVLPYFWWVDRYDRVRVNTLIYRRYAGLDAEEAKRWHRDTFDDNFGRCLFTEGEVSVRRHQEAGRRVVFITGGLDFVMTPLAERLGVSDVIAMHLVEEKGKFTGAIEGVLLANAEKAERLKQYAQTHDIDLADSYAYADCYADAAMMACVGHPVAVNPDRTLRAMAKGRGWPVEVWR